LATKKGTQGAEGCSKRTNLEEKERRRKILAKGNSRRARKDGEETTNNEGVSGVEGTN